MKGRSGRYITQPSGYKAFIPKNLPPSPALALDPKIEGKIIAAEKALSKLNGVGFLLPNPDLFITMAIRKEALLSSQIEGTQATMTDVLTYEAWNEVENFDDVEEVVNYIKALHNAIALLDELPLGIRIIKSSHKTLLQGERGKDKLPGEFRSSQNWIGPSLKNATFIPPPHAEASKMMSELEKFINSNDSLHPLVKCALLHYQFETLHPFLDGNGRIGRLLIDLFLYWKQVTEKPLLYISLFFKQHRQEYFDRLMLVREEGNFEQWISFFLKAIVWSSEHAIEKIKQVILLQQNLKQRTLGEKKASIRSIQLLDELFLSPLVTINDLAKTLGISYQGAKDQVSLFLHLEILEELTGQKRGKRYAFKPYLEIIEQ
jgi:Fic family protein